MSLKITLRAAAIRFGVNERTIYRWANKYAIAQFPDGTFDVHQLDALFNNYAKIEYLDIDWSKAACAGNADDGDDGDDDDYDDDDDDDDDDNDTDNDNHDECDDDDVWYYRG